MYTETSKCLHINIKCHQHIKALPHLTHCLPGYIPQKARVPTCCRKIIQFVKALLQHVTKRYMKLA